jgi:hypothetical protein
MSIDVASETENELPTTISAENADEIIEERFINAVITVSYRLNNYSGLTMLHLRASKLIASRWNGIVDAAGNIEEIGVSISKALRKRPYSRGESLAS